MHISIRGKEIGSDSERDGENGDKPEKGAEDKKISRETERDGQRDSQRKSKRKRKREQEAREEKS